MFMSPDVSIDKARRQAAVKSECESIGCLFCLMFRVVGGRTTGQRLLILRQPHVCYHPPLNSFTSTAVTLPCTTLNKHTIIALHCFVSCQILCAADLAEEAREWRDNRKMWLVEDVSKVRIF